MQLYKGLLVFEIYSLLAAFQWPPGKSGFQVARCIAVYSNTFLYNMKANRDLKKYFWWKTTRWFFWGVLSCFRGTATYEFEDIWTTCVHISPLVARRRPTKKRHFIRWNQKGTHNIHNPLIKCDRSKKLVLWKRVDEHFYQVQRQAFNVKWEP